MKNRLESLDVLRGFDMFFIFLPDPAPCVVFVFLAMLGLGDTAFAAQFDHVAGAGLHFYDCIFPLFLFISGVTWPFSLASQRAKGASETVITLKIVKRMVLLFAMGSMLWTVIDGTLERNVLSFDWEHFRTWSVIGRIGIAWGVAAFLCRLFGWRTRVGICAGILVTMWLTTRFVTAPGAPAGINPIEHPEYLFGRWMDVHYLMTAHRGEGGFYTITMVATAMLGNFAGEILRGATSSPVRKAVELAALAAGLVLLGLLLAFGCGSWSIPVYKGIWSSSFVLVAGGVSAGLLSLFYWIVDVKGWRRWGFFFKVIGMNAITIYILARTVLNYGFLKAYFFGGISQHLSAPVAEFVSQVGLIALGWTLLHYLYKKNIFLRV